MNVAHLFSSSVAKFYIMYQIQPLSKNIDEIQTFMHDSTKYMKKYFIYSCRKSIRVANSIFNDEFILAKYTQKNVLLNQQKFPLTHI